MLRALKSVAENSKSSFTIVDTDNRDKPLIFVNQAFTNLTGYSYSESVGHNCRFLQGDKTDLKNVKFIRECIISQTACCVDLLNYRKNGSEFWNRLVLIPFVDEDKNYFLGLQNDVTDKHLKNNDVDLKRIHESEICHKIRNPLSIALGYERLLTTQQLSLKKRQQFEDILQQTIERIDDLVINFENICEFDQFDYYFKK